jgi:dTMP kinase
MKKPLLVLIEGVDCSGKTTQAIRIVNALREMGYEVEHTREPGGTLYAERIRQVMLDQPDEEEIHPETELLLACAARVQNVTNRIIPALQQQKIVVCDRFMLSTFAYQVNPYCEEDGRVPWGSVFSATSGYIFQKIINAVPTLGTPITLLYVLSDQERWKRMENDTRVNNKFDKRSAAFFEGVNAGYMMGKDDPTVVVIDAEDDIDNITKKSIEAILKKMEEPDGSGNQQ